MWLVGYDVKQLPVKVNGSCSGLVMKQNLEGLEVKLHGLACETGIFNNNTHLEMGF